MLANRELIDFPHELKEANFHRRQDLSGLQSQDIADSDLALFSSRALCSFVVSCLILSAALLHTRSDGKNKAWPLKGAGLRRRAAPQGGGVKTNTS